MSLPSSVQPNTQNPQEKQVFPSLEASRQLMAPLLDQVQIDIEQMLPSQAAALLTVPRHNSPIICSGKMLRPLLTLICASLFQKKNGADSLLAAVCVEALHMASLWHDDVMDEALTRRHCPSLNSQIGNQKAVLWGDYLLAQTLHRLENCRPSYQGMRSAVPLVIECTLNMNLGQLLELESQGCWPAEGDYLNNYYNIIEGKTAALMGLACQLGGISAGADAGQAATLREVGRLLGMGFQIKDDILDYTGDPQITGKPRFNDAGQGRYTLPLLQAWHEADSSQRRQIQTWIQDTHNDALAEYLITSGALAWARQKAQDFYQQAAEKAQTLRGNIRNNSALDHLCGICQG